MDIIVMEHFEKDNTFGLTAVQMYATPVFNKSGYSTYNQSIV
jgi:hypothetical protein